MKTKPHQLAAMLHFFKGACKPRTGGLIEPQPKPIKKRMDYETRSTVETPRLTDEYCQMANGEIRRVDSKPRLGNGKQLRREAIVLRRLAKRHYFTEEDFYSSVHKQMHATQ